MERANAKEKPFDKDGQTQTQERMKGSHERVQKNKFLVATKPKFQAPSPILGWLEETTGAPTDMTDDAADETLRMNNKVVRIRNPNEVFSLSAIGDSSENEDVNDEEIVLQRSMRKAIPQHSVLLLWQWAHCSCTTMNRAPELDVQMMKKFNNIMLIISVDLPSWPNSTLSLQCF